MRSKRFITDFLPPADPDALRLLCFDIIKKFSIRGDVYSAIITQRARINFI